jgi:hypothetical protein
MKEKSGHLYMKLDRMKKSPAHAGAKARTLGPLRKLCLLYRSGRLVKGLLVIAAVSWIAYDNFTSHATAENIRYTVIFGALFLLVAIYMILSGILRILRAISVIEYGTVASATVTGISRSTRRTGTLSRGIYIRTWVAACRFQDAAGKNHKMEVIAPDENYLKKGDRVDIVYDAGLPSNALAIEAFPFFVKTDPPLKP